MAKNKLAHETSPYLLQHQANPVDWHPWGEEALALAQDLDKPILLSIGYSSCHWCHVMAHESFEDPETAALMNEHFINIKVDREERPDLDVIYQSALALMQQQGGWPLTMFLTPKGEPFWGGTYFPPQPRFGRPGFPQVLVGLSEAWTESRDKVTSNVAVINDALAALAHPQSGKPLDMDTVEQVASAMLRAIDPVKGGFRGAPKFPQVPYLKLLWRAWRRTGLALYFDAVASTLDHMAQGGIYDHLGGGFARYSTDDAWLVPHFEKMLYDNALLVSLMSAVWRETRSPLLEARVRETLDWVLGEMKVEDQDGFAFASALDADSDGEEGRFYVWNESEIDQALGDLAPVFKQTYGVSTQGNWSDGGAGVTVLARQTPYPSDPAIEEALREARAKLFAIRAQRPRPGRDGKVLADLNGLMIQAFTEAAVAYNEPSWLAAAQSAFAFVGRNMTDQGRLLRCWTDTQNGGRAQHRAVLDDIAQMSRAALALFEASGDEAYLAQAEAWTQQADDLFWCDHDNGYCLSARDATDVITRSRTSADNALPSGNGTMAEVLARLYLATGDDGYRAKAQALIDSFPAESAEAVANMPTLLNAYELLAGGAQVVIAGANGKAQPLLDAVLSAPGNLRVVLRTEGDDPLPPHHPAHGKGPVDGQAAAYVCRAGVCGQPLTDTDSLIKALEGL